MPVFQGIVSFGEIPRALRPAVGNLPAVFGAKPRSRAPVYMTWCVTERCSMRCKHCSMGPATPELTKQERTQVADKLARSGVWGVSLIGGEPTLVAELAEYVATLRARGVYTSVGTSGYRIGRHLRGLLEADLSNIVFSIDHYLAAEHDDFRGRKGLFHEASEAIARIRSHGKKRPRLQVRTTIHRRNYEALPDIVRYWRKRADNVVLQVVEDNRLHQVTDPSVLFRSDDRPGLEAVIRALQTAYPTLRTRYFDYMADYVFDREALRRRLDYRCLVVPGTSMLVMPNGDMRLCYGHETSTVGNLLRDEVRTTWHSTSTGCTRRHMQSRELECMCWEQTNTLNLNLVSRMPGATRGSNGGK